MTATSYSVRPPTSADRDRWHELYAGYAAFHKVRADRAGRHHRLGLAERPGPRGQRAAGGGPSGRVVALAQYRTFARPLTASTGCYLDDLYVDPAACGTGAVDALLAELRAQAQQHRWSVVRWITAQDNHHARAKYDQVAIAAGWITYDMPEEPPCSSPFARCTTARSCSA